MKEYIDKQELLNALNTCRWKMASDTTPIQALEVKFGNEMLDCIVMDRISDMPTFTQSDLENLAYNRGAREFAEKMREKLGCGVSNYLPINSTSEMVQSINELLKEMGCCDE